MKKVLITGASGRIGGELRKELVDAYDLVLFNRSNITDLRENEKLVRGNITDADAVKRASEGVDAIVHMAGYASDREFGEKLCPVNITGCYNVYQAALENSVKRVIYGSTNRVTSLYPVGQTVDESALYRPDSMYAITKCCGELMGRLFSEKGLEVVCLRIGSFTERPKVERHLATWISFRDMVQLVRCALTASDIVFEVVYGVSDNTRRWWDLSRAREVLGYKPKDDAEDYAGKVLEEPAEEWEKRVKYHGGRTYI